LGVDCGGSSTKIAGLIPFLVVFLGGLLIAYSVYFCKNFKWFL